MIRSHRVTFQFGKDVEVRYVTQLPVRGQLMRHVGKLWIVTTLRLDPTGGYEARLARPRDVVRRSRIDAIKMREASVAQRIRAARLAEGVAHVTERASRLRDRITG